MIIVAVVILVAIYIFVQPTKSREQFAINVEQDYRNAISKVFNIMLGRDPQEYEVQLYRDSMASPYDTANIEAKLAASAEYSNALKENAIEKYVDAAEKSPSLAAKSAPFPPPTGADAIVAGMDLGQRLAVYRSILSVYEKNLERLPTMKELNYYTAKLASDKSFTIEKLTQILQSSQEYTILQKNQTNVVNFELPGAITDAQLTLQVVQIYKSMFGAEPTKTFEDFAKAKFVEYNLDEPKFRKMLAMIYMVDSGNGDLMQIEKPTSTNNAGGDSKASGDVKASSKPTSGDVKASTNIAKNVVSVTQEASTVVPSSVPPVAQPKAPTVVPSSVPSVAQPIASSAVTSSSQSNASPPPSCSNISYGAAVPDQPYMLRTSQCSPCDAYNKNKFFDTLYTNIQNADAIQCIAAKNMNSSTVGERNRVAEAYTDRNKSQLGFECSRSELLDNVDKPYSYDPNVVPQLRNTKFGTFLDDANKTMVGSIMPRFIYKEYGYAGL